MSFAYFDTSAVVKRYVEEPGSTQVRALLRRRDLSSSAIAPVELVSALCRRRHDGELSESQFAAITRRLESDRRQWLLIEAGEPLLRRAETILQAAPRLRTLDAIHLASFSLVREESGLRVPFVTADARQQAAAKTMGMDVVWVG